MRLRALTIRRLPGVKEPVILDCVPDGITVVTGPNASGKSSILRALSAVLAPESDADSVDVTVEFESGDGERWRAERRHGPVQWFRDDEPSQAIPTAPSAPVLESHWLTVEDLMSPTAAWGDSANAGSLARQLAVELSGGIDYDQLRRSLLPSARSRQVLVAPARALRQARSVASQAARSAADLQQRQEAVESLEALLAAGAAQKVRLDCLVTVRDWHAAQGYLEQAQNRMRQFPVGIAAVTDKDLTAAQDFQEQLEKARAAAAEATRSRAVAEARARELHTADVADVERHLAGACTQLATASAALTARTAAERDLAGAEAAHHYSQDLLAAAGAGQSRRSPTCVSASELATAMSLADRHSLVHRRRQQLVANAPDVEPDPGPGSAEHLLAAEGCLQEWLAADALARPQSASPTATTTWLHWGVTVTGAAALATVVFLAVLASPSTSRALWLAGFGLLGLSCLLVASLRATQRQTQPVRGALSAARVRFEAVDVAPPQTWTRAAVAARAQQIRQEWLDTNQKSQQRLAAVQAAWALRDTDNELALVESEVAAFQEQHGFDPNQSAPQTALFLSRLNDFQRCHEEVLRCQASIETHDREYRQARSQACRHVAAATGTAPSLDCTLDELNRQVELVRSRLTTIRLADQEHKHARQMEASTATALNFTRSQWQQWWEDRGLEPGNAQTLQHRVSQLPEFRAASDELHRQAGVVDSLKQRIDQRPDSAELAELPLDVVLAEIETLEAEERKRDQLISDLGEVAGRVAAARERREVERAHAELCAAQDNVDAKFGMFVQGVIMEELIAFVEEAHERDARPAAIDQAIADFEMFTHGAFSFSLGTSGEVTAIDVLDGRRPLDPELLSTGTRTQLFLALRTGWLAVVAPAPGGLPLVLDEALTTTDESRFGVIAQSLARLARRDGRQVLCLSARFSDVHLWRHYCPEVHHLHLAPHGAGRHKEWIPTPLPHIDPPNIPSPVGLSSEQWAHMVGVRPICTQDSTESQDLWHLFRDDCHFVAELRRRYRIHSVGQFDILTAHEAPGILAESPARASDARLRCQLFTAWFGQLRLGRDLPIDEPVLRESGAVSSSFLGPVSELVAAVGGDGRALLERLRARDIKGFRDAKIDALEEWLHSSHYLDDRPTTTPDDRRLILIAQAADSVPVGDVDRWWRWWEAGVSLESPQRDKPPVEALA